MPYRLHGERLDSQSLRDQFHLDLTHRVFAMAEELAVEMDAYRLVRRQRHARILVLPTRFGK